MVNYNAAVEQNTFGIIGILQEKRRIDHLDIVDANASIAKPYPFMKEVELGEIMASQGRRV